MWKLLYSIDSLSSSVCMTAVLGQYLLRSATARFAPMGSIRPGSTSQFPDNLGNGVNDSNSRGARCLRVALGNGCGVISCVSLHLFACGACGLVSGVAAIRWGAQNADYRNRACMQGTHRAKLCHACGRVCECMGVAACATSGMPQSHMDMTHGDDTCATSGMPQSYTEMSQHG